jgi:arylsulfate sulfotransferase
MKMSRAVIGSFVGILVTLGSLGCGTVNFTPPVAAITQTSHPLVAQYGITHFNPGSTAWVEFGPTTSYGRQTAVVTGEHVLNILVAGMKPQTTYHMRAHVEWNRGSWVDQDRTFTTGAIPASLPLPQITGALTPNSSSSGGVEALSLVNGPTGGLQGVVTDLQGNVIWYCAGGAIPFKPMDNGDFIFMSGYALIEFDLLCNVVRQVTAAQITQSLQAHGYTFPPLDSFHHDMLVLPNGHWIALGQVTETLPVSGVPTSVAGDVLMDIDPTGEVVWAWSSFDHLDVNRHLYAMPDWTHSNALVYTGDGNLLLSMRGQSWILKIDYANGTGKGDILWKLGQDGDFQISGGDPSQWFYGQHNPSVVSVNGTQTTMAVYDDGNFRFDSSLVACGSSSSAPPCYTRAAILQIDESTHVASSQWEYRPGFFSFWGGSIEVLSNGNVEFDSSEPYNQFDSTGPFNPQESQIFEVTQTGSPEVVWQMTITGANAYRGFRIPSLYPGVTWQQ